METNDDDIMNQMNQMNQMYNEIGFLAETLANISVKIFVLEKILKDSNITNQNELTAIFDAAIKLMEDKKHAVICNNGPKNINKVH
jgi:hypothetical protein